MATNGHVEMKETEQFLPSNGVRDNIRTGKYIVSIMPKKDKDFEASVQLNGDGAPYDPFKERIVEHPTSDCDTLTHLLKASLGTGILAMPQAFKHAGVTVGVLCMILVSVVCTHCSYIVVKCAHILYYKAKVSSMSFPDVGEAAFTYGPLQGRKFAKLARFSIQAGLFATYFGACSVYTVIIAKNLQEVVDHYLGIDSEKRLYIVGLLLPLILLSWVPNLKALAPVSMVANIFMGLGLSITVYYLVQGLPSPADRPQTAPLSNLPVFFSISIFAIEAIGAVMPLENSMSTPRHFTGVFGVLNQGMSGVTVVYILIGFLGYVRYGDATADSITVNLPRDEWLAQSVKVLVALSVFCTYGLQYFVCLEIVWNGLKSNFPKNPRLAQYLVRTILTTATVLLAVAVPTIGPFVGLIGALCFSLLGLVFPVVIEVITYWDIGFGPGNWLLFKNAFLFVFGVLAIVFGSYLSVLDIIKEYSPSTVSLLNVTESAVKLLVNSTLATSADVNV